MLKENIFIDILKRALIALIIGIIIIFIATSDPKPYIVGLIFGMTINVLNFRLMSLSVKKALSLDPGKAQAYTVGNYMVRYMIYGIVLFVAASADHINLLTVIIGFFTVKGIIILDTFYDLIKGKRKKL